MRLTKPFLVLLISLSTAMAFGQDDDSKKQLADWGARHKSDSGTLLNPPLGSRSTQVKNVEATVRKIALNLYPDLAQRYQFTIGVYPSADINAFVERVQSEKYSGVLQKFYKLDIARPIYHIGVTLGLFNKLANEDQVAFVVAHELRHLLEGQVDAVSSENRASQANTWWSGQRFEAIADHGGIKSMVGKYEIQEAVEVLWILAQTHAASENGAGEQSEKSGERQVLNSINQLLSSHHDPSVRISMAQSYVEYLRKHVSSAAPRAIQKWSRNLGRLRNSRSFDNWRAQLPDWSEAEVARVVSLHNQLLNKVLSHELDENASLEFDIFTLAKGWLGSDDPKDPFILMRMMSDKTLHQVVSGRVQDILQNSVWTAEQKVAALLTSYLSLSQFDAGNFSQPSRTQDTYARAVVTLLKSNTVNLVTVMKTLRLAPSSVSKHPLFALLTVTKEGERLYRQATKSQLLLAGGRMAPIEKQWIDETMTVTADTFALEGQALFDVFKVFMPTYAQEQAVKNKTLFPHLIDQPYLKSAARIVNEELAQVAEYFNSDSFNKKIIADPTLMYDYVSLLWEIKKDVFPVEFRGNLFFKNASAREKFVFDYWTTKRTVFFKQLDDSKVFTQELINGLIDYYDIEWSLPFSEENIRILARNWNKLVDSDLEQNVSNRLADRMIGTVMTSGLLPVSNDKAVNLKSLLYIASRGGAQQALDFARVAQLFQQTSLDEIKKILTTHYFKQADLQLAEEMKSESYRNHLETVRKMEIKKEEGFADFFNMDNKAQFESFYFLETPKIWSQVEQDRHFNLLTLLSDETVSKLFATQFTLADLGRIVRNMHLLKYKERARNAQFTPPDIKAKLDTGSFSLGSVENEISGPGSRFNVSQFRDRLPFLFDVFALHQDEFSSLDTWVKSLRSILNISEAALDLRPDLKMVFETKFLQLSNQGQDPRAYLFVRNSSLRKTLTENSLVLVMLAEIKRRMGEKTSIEDLKLVFDGVNQDQKLQEKLSDVYDALKEKVAEEFKLQPNTINKIFPQTELELHTNNTEGYSTSIRGLSALTALARTRNREEQMQLIDYLMEREGKMPTFVLQWEKDLHQSVQPLVYGARVRLDHESELTRAFLVNCLLTGPQGLMDQPGVEEFLMTRLFGDSPNKDMIREISAALLKSLGRNKSMALAYVLGQKANATGKIDEGTALRSLLEAFGVAGIKLGQYLAFTSELEAFRDSLGELQDSALPVSYLEMLYLVRKRLGEDWSSKWKIVKLIGSGSVNLAIEVQSAKGETRVISILRDEIETASREDFRNLSNFVSELVKGPNGAKYGFLPGLLKIIEVSVTLEFDKENARQRQKDASAIYTRQVDGWTLRSPKVYKAENGSLMMEKALGKTARKIRKENFEMYKEVMEIVLKAELAHLINGQLIHLRPFPAFANPDLHDGQVIVNADKKTITILDFGQAVSISKGERDLGLDFLRMIAGKESKKSLQEQLERMRAHLGGPESLSSKEVSEIFAKKDKMDRFVYILGLVQKKNWNVPLATVHYVLGMNRVIKLGETIGNDVTKQLETIIKTRAVTNSTELGYYMAKLIDGAKSVERMCKSIVAP